MAPARSPTEDDRSGCALYVDDDELRRRINPKIGRDRFRAIVKRAELNGFPKANPLWGGRYWPSVKAWLDKDNEVTNDAPLIGGAQDGPEYFDAAPRTRPRPQTRPSQPALLDGKAGGARSHGISGHLRTVASGRD
ncbi:hypothetical protein [Rhodopseudomonas sp. BR0G17]|uniref:hypothetical protein n=1 Tax=Rhodopseudomonas sp. BR0G17 TaxID=2269368 RepID=UPI0013E0A489|nr:hypothetical protein [Rhodopseudomonas sp. BR0G17]